MSALSNKGVYSLNAPGALYGRKASTDDTDSENDTGHPDTGAEAAHDEVGGTVEYYVGDIEEGQCRRDVLGCEVQDRHQVMAHVRVHRLRQSDVRAQG